MVGLILSLVHGEAPVILKEVLNYTRNTASICTLAVLDSSVDVESGACFNGVSDRMVDEVPFRYSASPH